VRPADSFARLSFEKERIIGGKQILSSIDVHRIGVFDCTQIRQREQTRYVGIVHQIETTKSIDFVGVQFPKSRVIDDGVCE
jgi:cyanophycinase-like exopeptidase